MKVNKLLASFLCVLAASCSESDSLYVNPDDEFNEAYLKGWINKFGLIDEHHSWNMASTVKAQIDPASFGKGVTVNIYTADPNDGGYLIGRTGKSESLCLDVVRGSGQVFAVAYTSGPEIVAASYFTITDGSTTISSSEANPIPAYSRALSRAEGATPSFHWTIACEDLGSTDDFDFNDVVIGVRHIAGESKVAITGLAAGGVYAAHIYLDGALVGEIHDLVQEGSPTDLMLNTVTWRPTCRTVYVPVDNSWTIGDNMGGITIEVEGKETTIKAPAEGTAPQVFCVAGDWMWPVERKSIAFSYPDFEDWNGNADNVAWKDNPAADAVVDWDFDQEEEDEFAGGDDEGGDDEEEPVATHKSAAMISSQGAEWSSEWTHKSKKWDYVPGLVSESILAYCKQYPGDSNYASFLALAQGYADKGYTDSTMDGFVEGQLDNIQTGKVLISLYQLTADEKYKTGATTIYNYLRDSYSRIGNEYEGTGGFYHKMGDYPYQMWLDGLYMGSAFYAQYQAAFNPANDGWDDITKQFSIIHSHTYDTEKQLNYHAWSANPSDVNSFWAKKTDPYKGCSSEFWGRGMGWYFAALVNVLECMPSDNPNYTTLRGIYQQVAAGLKKWQDNASGVWYQLLQYDSSFANTYKWNSETGAYDISGGNPNYLEASASCMITYAMLKGIRLGLISEDEYGTSAEKAYQGLLTQFVTTSDGTISLNRICRTAGLGPESKPERDGSASYYLNNTNESADIVSNDGKGIGPFIFASLEYELRHAE